MAEQEPQGALLGKSALRQISEMIRMTLRGYRNTGVRPGPPPADGGLIEFMLGEELEAASDPFTLAQCSYARAYVYGRDVDGNGVYLRQQYIWNMFTGVTGGFAQYGTAAFIAGRWCAQTLDCDPLQDWEEPEPLDEFLPDKPAV